MAVLEQAEITVAVTGLGYVGLPLALAFAKKMRVIGFDTNEKRIKMMGQHIDPSKELPAEQFAGADIYFTHNPEDLRLANFFIVAVPTPIDEHNVPDLSFLIAACNTIGQVIKQNDYVVFESTVYPGCTEEDCIPVIEKLSGLKAGSDFKYGYSPERVNPGDKIHTLENVVKVVSGSDAESLEKIAQVYGKIVTAGVYKASSVKVAEAAKVIENSQRDLNIALMNELSIIFNKMNINTYEVLEAAATKWNFLNFTPGLVGGHCIGVDPYYLTYKAAELGYNSKVILSGRSTNDGMAAYVAKKVLQHIIETNGNIKQSKVLVMGVTFKENVSDIRNSKVAEMIRELQSFSINVDVTDPYASSDELEAEYGFSLTKTVAADYDAVVIAVCHQQYAGLDESYFSSITKKDALMADLKGSYRGKISALKYWSL